MRIREAFLHNVTHRISFTWPLYQFVAEGGLAKPLRRVVFEEACRYYLPFLWRSHRVSTSKLRVSCKQFVEEVGSGAFPGGPWVWSRIRPSRKEALGGRVAEPHILV